MGCKSCREDSAVIELDTTVIQKAKIDAMVDEIRYTGKMKKRIVKAHVDAMKMKIESEAKLNYMIDDFEATNTACGKITNDLAKTLIIYEKKSDMLDKFNVHTLTISDTTAGKILPKPDY